MYLRTLVSVRFMIPHEVDPASLWQGTSAPLSCGSSPIYPLHRRLAGSQIWYGNGGKEKGISPRIELLSSIWKPDILLSYHSSSSYKGLADYPALPGYLFIPIAVCSFPFITSAINCCGRHIRGYGAVA
jgi:hypothetical protein